MAIYWDDEMDVFSGPGNTQANFGTITGLSAPDPDGFTRDIVTKYTGAASLRYNFPPKCQTSGPGQPCGGASTRMFPAGTTLYGRFMFRISDNWQWGAPNGQSKILGVRSSLGVSRFWFNMYFGLGMIISAENTPNTGSTTNISIGITMSRNEWTCIEYKCVANTPGVPNGGLQIWKNGVLCNVTYMGLTSTNHTAIQWRGTGNTSLWDFIMFYRQGGGPIAPAPVGHIWHDRVAVGNTRIGLVGGDPPPPDPETSDASIASIVSDATGADITFTGSAYAIRYWDDLHPRVSPVTVSGLGGVSSYRLSKVWEAEITFVCMEAQDVDGTWQSFIDSNSYLCTSVTPGGAPGDTTAPAVPTNLRFV